MRPGNSSAGEPIVRREYPFPFKTDRKPDHQSPMRICCMIWNVLLADLMDQGVSETKLPEDSRPAFRNSSSIHG